MANKPLKSIKFPGLSDTYTVPEVDATLTTQGAAADAKAVGDALSGISVETDKTLTITDKPADAKKVGDEISDIKAEISDKSALLDYVVNIGTNKWNPATVLSNTNIGNNSSTSDYGKTIAGDGYYTSDYIDVDGGDTVSWFYNNDASAVTVVRSTMFRVAEYDENKNVISVSANWAQSPFTTNQSTKYVRIVLSANRTLNMLVLNSTADSLPYEVYSKVEDFYRIKEIESDIEKQRHLEKLVEIESSVNKWNPDAAHSNMGISTTQSTYGKLVEASGNITSDYIPLLKGQSVMYYFSNSETTPTAMAYGGSVLRIAEYDKNMDCLLVTGNWASVPYIPQNADTRFVRIQLASIPNWVMMIIDDDTIWQKPFVPYIADYNLLANVSKKAESFDSGAEVILPSAIYGVTGQEINIYKENLVLNERLRTMTFIHTQLPNDSIQDDYRTIWNPSADTLTETVYAWEIMTNGLKATNIKRQNIKVCIAPKNTGGGSIKVLIIGDSKVDNGFISYHFLHSFDDEDMTCTLLGSKYDWQEENRNEGWGGKTAKWFCTNAESPLSYNGVCDFSRYLNTYSIDTPDFVFINLGTNDCAGMSGGTNAYLTEFITYITQMITSIHAVRSDISVIIGLVEGCATVKYTNNAAFDKWDLNQKISNLHKATIEAFDNRQDEHIYVCPIYMGMDLQNDYNITEVPLSMRDGDLNTGKTRMQITDHIHQSEVGYWKNADYMYAIAKYIVAKSSL